MIDISMPRDLVRRRKNAGYAAICAVGYDAEPRVFRLATAENIEGHLALLQPGRWEELYFARVVWTPGLAVARTIVVGVEAALTAADAYLGQHWFGAERNQLDELLRLGIDKLRSPSWSHAELIARLKRQAEREADRFAEGIF